MLVVSWLDRYYTVISKLTSKITTLGDSLRKTFQKQTKVENSQKSRLRYLGIRSPYGNLKFTNPGHHMVTRTLPNQLAIWRPRWHQPRSAYGDRLDASSGILPPGHYQTRSPYGDRDDISPGGHMATGMTSAQAAIWPPGWCKLGSTYGDRSDASPGRHMATSSMQARVAIWRPAPCKLGLPYGDRPNARPGRYMATSSMQARVAIWRPTWWKPGLYSDRHDPFPTLLF